MDPCRHVHQRRDGITVLCTGRWCAPSRWRELGCRALLVAAPFAVVAASIALGPRRFALALAGVAVAASLAFGTRTLGARLDRACGGQGGARSDHATGRGTGSAA